MSVESERRPRRARPTAGPRTRRRTPADATAAGVPCPPTRDYQAKTDVGAGRFTEQDLAEREARLQRSGGYLKMRRQQAKRAQQGDRPPMPSTSGGRVRIIEPFTIKDLSAATGVKGADIVKKLFLQGVMATINSGIEGAQAQEIMMDWDIELEVVAAKNAEQVVSDEFVDREI